MFSLQKKRIKREEVYFFCPMSTTFGLHILRYFGKLFLQHYT